MFIDADVIVKRDPADLYNIDLEGKVLAAVQDYYSKFSQEAKDAIGLKDNSDYFNSGIMVVDLKKWKEHKIEEKAIEFAVKKGHLTKLHDQDAFNHAVNGRWLKVSPLWNPRPNNIFVDERSNRVTMSKDQVYAKDLAYFVHYSGQNKPWLFTSAHSRKKDYLYFLRKTGFEDYKFPDKNIFGYFKRLNNKYKQLRKNFIKKSN